MGRQWGTGHRQKETCGTGRMATLFVPDRGARGPTTARALMNDLHWMEIDDYNPNCRYYSLVWSPCIIIIMHLLSVNATLPLHTDD